MGPGRAVEGWLVVAVWRPSDSSWCQIGRKAFIWVRFDPVTRGAGQLGNLDGLATEFDAIVGRARAAADAFRRLEQEAVDRIVWAMVVAGLGKVVKNYVTTEFRTTT